MGRKTGIVLILIVALMVRGIQLETMEKEKGVVTDIRMIQSGGFRFSHQAELPIASFPYYGKIYQSREDMAPKFISTFRIGDTTTVYFPKAEPEMAELYSLSTYWLSIPFLAIVALIIIIWMGFHNIINMQP